MSEGTLHLLDDDEHNEPDDPLARVKLAPCTLTNDEAKARKTARIAALKRQGLIVRDGPRGLTVFRWIKESVPAFKHYEWREPGDPPGGTLVRDKPLAAPVKHASLTLDLERELLRRYWENADEDALDRLVGAYRPMVVRMAKHMSRTGVPLNVLVEYGTLGVRLAAEPPRPSKTRKGKSVGFDPSTGYRFSTYARHYAAKEMRAAIADDVYEPAVKSEFKQKVTVAAEEWSVAESLRGPLPSILRYLRDRRASPPCIRPWTLWNPPKWAKDQLKRKVKARDYRDQPITPGELGGKDAFYGVWTYSLKGFEKIAAEGMEGWEGDDDLDPIEGAQAEFLVASFFSSDTLNGRVDRARKGRSARVGCASAHQPAH